MQTRNNMNTKETYRGQTIMIWSPTDVTYYLFDKDGDMCEFPVHSIETAKARIDAFIECAGGYYNSNGDLVKE